MNKQRMPISLSLSLILSVVLVTLLMAGCTPIAPSPVAQPPIQIPDSGPVAVVQALADALNVGDVDAAMAIMTDNPTFTTDDTLQGAEAVRGLYEELVADNFRIQPSVVSVEGNTVKSLTLTWGAGMPKPLEPLEADEIYVLENGRIASISWTPTAATQTRMADFMAQMEAAAEAQPAEAIMITFDGDQCAYSGPDLVSGGQPITVSLDVLDQTAYNYYGAAVVTLAEGKTFEDLENLAGSNQPNWATIKVFLGPFPQGTLNEEAVTFTDGPLYVVCFVSGSTSSASKTGTLGPIEVSAISQ